MPETQEQRDERMKRIGEIGPGGCIQNPRVTEGKNKFQFGATNPIKAESDPVTLEMLIKWLEDEGNDLRSVQTGDTHHWIVVEHYEEAPTERVLGEGPTCFEALEIAYHRDIQGLPYLYGTSAVYTDSCQIKPVPPPSRADVEQYLTTLCWDGEREEHKFDLISTVNGNIRGFYAWMLENMGLDSDEQTTPANENKPFPVEWNEDTKWILGLPNFQCGPLARILRGQEFVIDCKAETEQAFVICFFLNLYLQDKKTWKEEASKVLGRII